MVMEVFMNCSMPRAGSTLLQNVLAQNPDFYCTPTSGIMDLMLESRSNFTFNPSVAAQDEDGMKNAFQQFCQKGLHGYFNALTDKKYVVDKNRGWSINYNFAEFVLGKTPKIIGLVRDLPQIFSSLELKYRNSPHKDPGFVNHAEFVNTTTSKRVEHFASNPPLGISLERILETIQQGIHQKMMFIRYEDLCSDPISIMKDVYKYLDVPYYEHNFELIEQTTKENDTIHGIFGDHKIRNTLGYKDNKPEEVLGEEKITWIKENYSWYYDMFNYAM